MWKNFNPNPNNSKVDDCVIRALCRALDQSWEDTYLGVCLYGLKNYDMPSANHVWGAYLRSKGFTRSILPNTCPDCYTVRDFCNEYSDGTYILSLNSHVVCVQNGNYYDTWDSGDEIPIYYWKEDKQ